MQRKTAIKRIMSFGLLDRNGAADFLEWCTFVNGMTNYHAVQLAERTAQLKSRLGRKENENND